MQSAKSFQIGLLGLGNLMRTDDAVGMLTLEKLSEDTRLPPHVRIIAGGTLGLDLLESLHGITHLLALDAVDTGAAPGALTRFNGQELNELPVSKSVHLLGFSDLLGVLRLMDASPVEIVLLGVQPESTDWGTSLTSSVEAAQGDIIAAALAQIANWAQDNPELTNRANPCPQRLRSNEPACL